MIDLDGLLSETTKRRGRAELWSLHEETSFRTAGAADQKVLANLSLCTK